ncbi:MAG: hypothetical protein ACR2OZ_16875 [Verrucomicrobiales bacterium]
MRRRRPQRFPFATALLIAVPVAVAAIIAWKTFAGRTEQFGGVPELKIRDYFENANSLRGNTYQVRGTVEDSLRWVAGKGRLISVIAQNSDGTPADPLPIRVPPQITENIQTGQSFVFKVSVGDGGVLVAEKIRKN